METKHTKGIRNSLRNILAAGIIGLAGLVQTATAEEKKPVEIRTTGDVTYFIGGEAESGAQTSYLQIDHSTSFPYNFKVSGFMDLYEDGNGYFGKTIVEKGLAGRLNFRGHIVHIDDPFSQAGFGLSYALPTPKGTYAKVGYLPFFLDSEGQHMDHKQALCFGAGVDLAKDVTLSAFGEMNVAAEKGPQWSYGEIELAKKFGKHLSVGANLQLNCQGPGEEAPEVVPRLSLRYRF